MYMTQLVYVSTANNPVEQDAEDILEVARRHNAEHDVTGLLHYTNGFYVQCLEGSRESVNYIYNKITSDERHSNVILLAYRHVDERRFPNWSMAFVSGDKLEEDIFFKYAIHKKFDPYAISPESADLLLKELAEHVEEIVDQN